MKRLINYIAGLAAALALLAGCAVIDHSAPSGADKSAAWVLLPFGNATETPFAGQRAEAVTENLLRALGVANVQRYSVRSAARQPVRDRAGEGRRQGDRVGEGARRALCGHRHGR